MHEMPMLICMCYSISVLLWCHHFCSFLRHAFAVLFCSNWPVEISKSKSKYIMNPQNSTAFYCVNKCLKSITHIIHHFDSWDVPCPGKTRCNIWVTPPDEGNWFFGIIVWCMGPCSWWTGLPEGGLVWFYIRLQPHFTFMVLVYHPYPPPSSPI